MNTSHMPLFWESSDTVINFSLPRKYTSTHDDIKREIYLSIGKDYNKRLLSTEEVKNVESQIIGEWVSSKKIKLEAIVSSVKNPNAKIRDQIIRHELPTVLKQIGLAEVGLVTLHPKLGRAKIYIHFISIDSKYDKTEYIGRLKKFI